MCTQIRLFQQEQSDQALDCFMICALWVNKRKFSVYTVKHLTMLKAQMHAGAISKLLYGFVPVRAIIHSLKLVIYFLVQTHNPYNKLHL